MYTIDGRFASALLTIDTLEAEAVSQLYGLLNARSSEGSHVAIMPDGHPGGSCLVGFTQRFADGAETRIVPNFVGGGNHFISLERSEKSGMIYLIVHTGSRHFGKSVCKVFQQMAANAHPKGAGSFGNQAEPWRLVHHDHRYVDRRGARGV